MTTSTVYKTSIYTITSCAATVTDCPAKIGLVTTEVISLSTTVCPVTESGSQVTATSIPASNIPSVPGSKVVASSSVVASGVGAGSSPYVAANVAGSSKVVAASSSTAAPYTPSNSQPSVLVPGSKTISTKISGTGAAVAASSTYATAGAAGVRVVIGGLAFVLGAVILLV